MFPLFTFQILENSQIRRSDPTHRVKYGVMTSIFS